MATTSYAIGNDNDKQKVWGIKSGGANNAGDAIEVAVQACCGGSGDNDKHVAAGGGSDRVGGVSGSLVENSWN